jgi:DNA-binding beta-propeller fold protein YncE
VSCLTPGTVSVIDTATKQACCQRIEVDPFPLVLAVDPDGSRVYVVNS